MATTETTDDSYEEKSSSSHPHSQQPGSDPQPEFSDVPLDMEKGKKKKVPRRIIHFVNGDTLEEYSTDEEEEEDSKPPPVDPKTLTWIPWFWYYTVYTAAKTLGAADFCGEKLAWLFGITSPKYQFAIDEYNKLKEEEEEEERRLERQQEADRVIKTNEVETLESGDNDVNTEVTIK